MTGLNFTNKTPVFADSDIRNDAFRRAFEALSRAIVPFFDLSCAYYGDLLWDARTAATLAEGDTVFLMARSLGTSFMFPQDQSYDSIAVCYTEARRLADSSATKNFPTAVFSIKRESTLNFIVTHLVTRQWTEVAL
jgi:hypothetical protein